MFHYFEVNILDESLNIKRLYLAHELVNNNFFFCGETVDSQTSMLSLLCKCKTFRKKN